VIKIGQYTFEVPPPKAMPSFALQQRLFPILARALGVVLHYAPHLSLGEGKGINIGAILNDPKFIDAVAKAMPSLGEVIAAMPEGELERLTRELLGEATVSGWGTSKAILLFDKAKGIDTFDQVMQGRTMDTWRLLGHAVEVWYPDFLSLAKGSRASVPAGEPSKGSTT
jgi:hypothetical protein